MLKKHRLRYFWKYYIKGEYHCDICPFCWGGEYLPGCDDYEDAGCYIKGEISGGSCRLIPPIRFILGWGRRRKAQYYEAHQYDDCDVFYEKWYSEQEQIKEALNKYLKQMHYGITYADENGCVIPTLVDNEHMYTVIEDYYEFYRFVDACEDILSPYKYETLGTKWKDVLKATWNKFIMIFKPYFCR